MKADATKLLYFLQKSSQFAIPIYQRNYSWSEAQCKQLWEDIMRAGKDETIKAHFIGSIVYVERGHQSVTSKEPLLVIDGQQRLTTSTLLITALASYLEENDIEVLDAFSSLRLREEFLINRHEKGDSYFKLILSEKDKDTLVSILTKAPMPINVSKRIHENYQLFLDLISKHHEELETICRGLDKLSIVDVSLDRSQDNPQLIFESMNSTGLELSQADLIRNYVLMGLEPDLQTELYKMYWRPMEMTFGQAAYAIHFDSFMRHYLTAKTGEIPNVREVYKAFKIFAHRFKDDIRALLKDIHQYAVYYSTIALGSEIEPKLKRAFQDLRELKVDVSYPFLLDVYHDFKSGLLSIVEMEAVVRLVESYVFRRAICGIPTNSMNKIFAGMIRSIKKDNYLESINATFLLLPSYRRFPSDDEFIREIQIKDLYNFRNKSYWLRRLENYGRKERIVVEDYSIEHIMPQNPDISLEWQQDLGEEWQRVQQEWLHTLGNLTLTGYNSEYSDYAFSYKCEEVTDKDGNKIGLRYSPLKLNEEFIHVNKWDEAAIKKRAEKLAYKAVKVWAVPIIDSSKLIHYKPNIKTNHNYQLNDHPHLNNEVVNHLYTELRKEILSLDPCVHEEILKLYIAYKAETNFVDIIPQAKCLKLILNMPYHQIDDAKNMCRDITDLGRWGNGDIEVELNNPNDIPYILGLIRQSLDYQMVDTQIY